jgi:hypothetical protein
MPYNLVNSRCGQSVHKMMDASADSVLQYFCDRVSNLRTSYLVWSKLPHTTPYFVNSEAPNAETCWKSISPKNGFCSHMEYTNNLKKAHAILDLMKYIILFYEIECISSLTQSHVINELSKKNGVSKKEDDTYDRKPLNRAIGGVADEIWKAGEI